jgi:hypothetical protein
MDNFALSGHALTIVFVSKKIEVLRQLIPSSEDLPAFGSRSEAIPHNFSIVDFASLQSLLKKVS